MRNIIITGGGFSNKGAQAMTYITIAELSRRFPDHKIFLLTSETIDPQQLGRFSERVFTLCWYPQKFAKAQHNKALQILCRLKNGREYNAAVSVYRDCDLMVDISGYALGSDWSYKISSDYLDNIEYAKAFQIPVILMPQSFGPFNYEKDSPINKRIATLLSYVSIICAREQDGYDLLRNQYHLTNVVFKPDVVLNSKHDLYHEVFDSQIEIPDILPDSVAVIPNENVVNRLGEEQTLATYKYIIDHLLDRGLHAYIIGHSNNDIDFCKKIKNVFSQNDNVICLSQDFSCVVFNEMVKRFRFCIASRFHSIVHSFKNGIPCIAIGWAIKYRDLLHQFSQDPYLFAVDKPLEKDAVLAAIDRMIANEQKESDTISGILNDIQKDNIFDLLNEVS